MTDNQNTDQKEMRMKKIAFIGTGIMGAPMVRHLMAAGFPVTVTSRTLSKCEPLVQDGATLATCTKDCVADADVIISIVGYPSEVEELYLGSGGIIQNAKPGSVLIDMSTSSPALARDIHDAAAIHDILAIDAPVTGGEDGAIAGNMTIMVGADEEGFERVRDVLEAFGEVIVPFGGPGLGQVAKIANQVALAGSMVGMAEGLVFAQQNGVDPKAVLPILQTGSASSRALELLAPRALDGNFQPGFMVEHFRKDLGIALTIAEDEELTLPGVETAYALYDLLAIIGGGRLGTQSVFLAYQDEEASAAQGLDWSRIEEDPEEVDEHNHV